MQKINVLVEEENVDVWIDDKKQLKITSSIEEWKQNPSEMILFVKNGKKYYHFAIKRGENVYFTWIEFKRSTFFVTGIYVIMSFEVFDPNEFSRYTRKELPFAIKKPIQCSDTENGKRVKVRLIEPSINFYFWRSKDEQKYGTLTSKKEENPYLFQFDF